MSRAIDFNRISEEELPQAKRIAEYFKTHLKSWDVVIDVGCGPGIYVHAINEARDTGRCYGVDNNEQMPSHLDLNKVDVTGISTWPASVVLSLEVGEHISMNDADAYISFIRRTGAHTVYFSAAAPGQGGEGHINCQPKVYWCEKFFRAGFYYDPDERNHWLKFMSEGYHMGWLMQNGMVFRRG